MGYPVPNIIAIRVQDIQRQIWFEWNDPQGWSGGVRPTCVKNSPIYIAAYAINIGKDAGIIKIELLDDETKIPLQAKVELVAPEAGIGIEWTGVFPYTESMRFRVRAVPLVEIVWSEVGFTVVGIVQPTPPVPPIAPPEAPPTTPPEAPPTAPPEAPTPTPPTAPLTPYELVVLSVVNAWATFESAFAELNLPSPPRPFFIPRMGQ